MIAAFVAFSVLGVLLYTVVACAWAALRVPPPAPLPRKEYVDRDDYPYVTYEAVAQWLPFQIRSDIERVH